MQIQDIQKFLGHVNVAGLRQKLADKKAQRYMHRGFDMVLPSFLMYLGFRRFLVFGVFPLLYKDLRLILSSKIFKSQYLFLF